MGMYDDIKCDDERVVCAAGHRLRDLQTKDLDCDLDSYWVVGKQLYLRRRRGSEPQSRTELTDEGLVFVSHVVATRDDFTGKIVAYTECDECDPVVFDEFESSPMSRWGIKTAQPWCEVELEFFEGALVEVRPISLETRAEVRAKAGPGHQALPDDDRVAAKTIADVRARRSAG